MRAKRQFSGPLDPGRSRSSRPASCSLPTVCGPTMPRRRRFTFNSTCAAGFTALFTVTMGLTLDYPLHPWTYRLKFLQGELGGRGARVALLETRKSTFFSHSDPAIVQWMSERRLDV